MPELDEHRQHSHEPRGHANVRMAGLVSARFRAGMRPLALGTGLVVALSAPLADFLLERHDLAHRAFLEASEVARQIQGSNVVDRQDVAGILRAVQASQDSRRSEEVARIEFLDTSGQVRLQTAPHGKTPAWPLVASEAPLSIRGQPAGTIRVEVGEVEWLDRDLLLLGVFGVLGLVLGLALYFFPLRLFREEDLVRLFARRSIGAAEEERLRLSRDLHDGIGQALGAAAIGVARLKARAGSSVEADETARLIDGALDELRRVTLGLRPPSLDDLGLGPAVEALVREAAGTGLVTRVDIQPLPRLDAELEQTCFRLAQEALSNVVHHAAATTVRVSLARQAATVVLEVQDDGRGFSPGLGMGLGLVGARERAARLEGSLEIESTPGSGTRLRAILPWREAA
jgi:signal transduction histidine kinase